MNLKIILYLYKVSVTNLTTTLQLSMVLIHQVDIFNVHVLFVGLGTLSEGATEFQLFVEGVLDHILHRI